jgi:hypothetical protein
MDVWSRHGVRVIDHDVESSVVELTAATGARVAPLIGVTKNVCSTREINHDPPAGPDKTNSRGACKAAAISFWYIAAFAI